MRDLLLAGSLAVILVVVVAGVVPVLVGLVALFGAMLVAGVLNTHDGRVGRCRLCGLPFSNLAAHVPTPELVGPNESAVFWCAESERHITLPVGWTEDVRRSVRSVRNVLALGRSRR